MEGVGNGFQTPGSILQNQRDLTKKGLIKLSPPGMFYKIVPSTTSR
jgi:hypothetical protein